MWFFGQLLLFILQSPQFREFLFKAFDSYLTPLKVFSKSLTKNTDPLEVFNFFTSLSDETKRRVNNLFSQSDITGLVQKSLQSVPLSEIKNNFRSVSDYTNLVQGLNRAVAEQKVGDILHRSAQATQGLYDEANANFNRAFKKTPHESDPLLNILDKSENKQLATKIQENKIGKYESNAIRPQTKVNVFIDMVSSAIKGGMFIPYVARKDSGAVFGITLIIFKTNPHKIYNYYNINLALFNRMVQAVGPEGNPKIPGSGNGAWSVYLDAIGRSFGKIGLRKARSQERRIYKYANNYAKYQRVR